MVLFEKGARASARVCVCVDFSCAMNMLSTCIEVCKMICL